MADRDSLTLPEFTLDGYAEFLGALADLGYDIRPASSAMEPDRDRVVFLRHDVDLHLEGALDMARVEEDAGVRSTWYIGTRLAYNPAYGPNAAVIHGLAERGHTIGLHYVAGQPYIGADVSTLNALLPLNTDIRSWVMHEPSAGGKDYHAKSAENPHSHGLHYVSDSGMRWHEPWLSQLLAGEPERAMLNTHHEHWIHGSHRREIAGWIRQAAYEPQRAYLSHLLKDYADAPA